jgi:Ankyrin repeats (3 copies)
MPQKKNNTTSELVTNAIYTQIERGDVSEKDIIDTINGSVGIIDFSKKFGMFKDTLLMHALSNDLQEVVMKFIDLAKKVKGVDLDVNHKNESGDYALLTACDRNYPEAALGLLEIGATICDPDDKGNTPLMYTMYHNELYPVTERILEKGICNIDHKNDFGGYALLLACKRHNLRAALALLNHGAKLCEPDQKGYTPLMYASQDMNMYPVVERILQKNICKVDHVNDSGDALSTTILIGNPKATKLLIDYYLKNDQNNEVFLKNVEEICKDEELVDDIKKIYSGPEHEEFIKTICGDVVQARAELVNPSQENKEIAIQIAKPVSTSIEMIADKEAEEVPTALPIHGDPDFNASDPDERGILQPKRLGGKSRKRKGKKGRKTRKNKKKVTKKNKRKTH